tara:strand:- start:59 stop:505 length:447 start_codon:yes stop_codon:yes gene_type:complete
LSCLIDQPRISRFRFSLVTGLALLMAHAAAVSPVRAEWSPASESSAWRELRRRELPGEGWTFVEATRTDRFEAAEYLRNPTAVDKSVEMEAGVLIKRSGQSAWSSRVLPMRANCTEGRMEQKDAEGQWTPYPGRAGTAVKVRWICSLP